MGAFILEHVSEIMADICNNNYTNIIMSAIISLTCSKIKVPKYVLNWEKNAYPIHIFYLKCIFHHDSSISDCIIDNQHELPIVLLSIIFLISFFDLAVANLAL